MYSINSSTNTSPKLLLYSTQTKLTGLKPHFMVQDVRIKRALIKLCKHCINKYSGPISTVLNKY